MRDVPAPPMFAPILLRHAATSAISGSRAAFSITVVPRASAAAITRRMGAADRHLGKVDFAADEPARRAGDHIAAVDLDLGAELLQRHDQEIDRPRADGAAARQRHPGLAHAGQQRRRSPKTRPHFRDEFVGRGGIDDVSRRDMQGLALVGGVARPLAATITSTP